MIILILLLLLTIQIIGAYFTRGLEESLEENFINNVQDRLQVLTYNLEEAFNKERPEDEDGPSLEEDVQNILRLYDSELYSDLQVIDLQSRVIGANKQLDRIGKRVTGSGITRVIRFGDPRQPDIYRDPTTGNRMLVSITPLYNGEKIVGVVRLEALMEDVYAQVQSINRVFLNGTIYAIIVSAILGIIVAGTITKPITEMKKQAKVMSTGDFSQKVNVYGYDEIGQLAITFNEMNDKLKQAHLTTEGERRKLSSVLANMSDGVIATDETGAIILMNKAADD